MKTSYSVYTMLGSQINTDSLKSAIKSFDLMLNARTLTDNESGEVIKSREHKKVGFISSGIRFMGNIIIYECSDNNRLTTNIGNSKDSEMERISNIEKNRNGATEYFEY